MEHTWSIIQLNTVASTNTYAQSLISEKKIADETVVNANVQLQGKGQAGNTWESEHSLNLTFSIVLQPKYLKVEDQFYITQAVSLGIVDFLKLNKIQSRIKWPNDILVGQKKIAGILLENSIMGELLQYSVIGIGININQEDFKSLSSTAISMKNISGVNHNLDFALHELLNCIYARVEELKSLHFEELKSDYLLNLYQYKKWGHYNADNKNFDGIITDVRSSGELLITDVQGETHTFLHKEVIFL